MQILEINGIDDVNENITKGVYERKNLKPKKKMPETHIFDEDKTVKWNRAELKKYNEEVAEHNELVKQEKTTGHWDFEKDLIVAIEKDYNLNTEQAKEVYIMANEEGHSVGNYEIVNYAIDYGSLAKKILTLATPN